MPLHVPMHIDFSGTVSDLRFFKQGRKKGRNVEERGKDRVRRERRKLFSS